MSIGGNHCNSMYLDALEQAVRDVTMQVDFLSNAAVSCGDDDWLAIIDIGDMTEKCLIKDGVHGLFVVLSASSTSLDFSSGCHSVQSIICTPKALDDRMQTDHMHKALLYALSCQGSECLW